MQSIKIIQQYKKAFTLLELIVVLLIISLISFLTLSVVAKEGSKKKDRVEILNLKNSLLKSSNKEDSTFFCIAQNSRCFIATDEKVISYGGDVKLSKNMEVYSLGEDRRLQKLEDFGKYRDEKISFAYQLYANGSAQPIILKDENGVYFIPSYFGESLKAKDVDEARALWIDDEYDLKDSGAYY
jgi:prepilin-type N-terminal cleavage/methylation domain-containing protein